MIELDLWEKRQRRTGFYHGWLGASALGCVLLALSGDLTAAAVWAGVSTASVVLGLVRAAQARRKALQLVAHENRRMLNGHPVHMKSTEAHLNDYRLAETLWRMPTEEETQK